MLYIEAEMKMILLLRNELSLKFSTKIIYLRHFDAFLHYPMSIILFIFIFNSITKFTDVIYYQIRLRGASY